MVIAGGFVVEFFDPRDAAADFVGFGVENIFNDGNAGTLGEFLNGFYEGNIFVVHDEGDGRATLLAAETMVELLGGADVKGGGLFVVEGAVAFVLASSSFEREIGTDQVHDVSGIEDLFNGFFRNAAHGETVPRVSDEGNENFALS